MRRSTPNKLRVDRRAEPAGPAAAADAASLGAGAASRWRSPSTIRRASRWTCPNTTLALPSRRIDVHARAASTPMLAAEAAGRTRLVLNLDRLLPYTTRVSGNDVIVLIGGAARRRRRRGRLERRRRLAAPAHASAAPSGPRAIRGIDFRRGAGGAGRVIVQPVRSAHAGQPAPARQPDRRRLRRRRSCRAIWRAATTPPISRTPVSGFDVVRVGNGVRLAITATGDFEQLAYQSDDQYVVEVQPAPQGGRRSRRQDASTRASA